MPRRFFAHAVDADMAGFDQGGSTCARFHHARVPQPFIETLSIQRLAILVAGELFFQRGEFSEWRIGIDRPVTLTRRGAGGILPVRRATVAAALVTPAEIAAAFVAITPTALVAVALVAIAAEFFRTATAAALVAAVIVFPALAFKAFARRTVVGA